MQVQMDELWGYIHTKENNLGADDPRECGNAYLWLAMDSETKLIISHTVGAQYQFLFRREVVAIS
jgi:hypothetical protein